MSGKSMKAFDLFKLNYLTGEIMNLELNRLDQSGSLWSDSARERITAARTLKAENKQEIRELVASSSPQKPWPYGMPTTINPMLAILGVSPGNSAAEGDIPHPYEEPTVGEAHPGFHYIDTKSYWQKIRELSVGLLRAFDESLTEDECYALSGHLNLGIGRAGEANNDSVEKEFAKWVPDILLQTLRPKVIVLVGLTSLLKKHPNLSGWMASSGNLEVNWESPDEVFTFKSYTNKKMLFRVWDIKSSECSTTKIISWPNHPSRSPMTDKNMWSASVSEAYDYLKKSALIS